MCVWGYILKEGGGFRGRGVRLHSRDELCMKLFELCCFTLVRLLLRLASPPGDLRVQGSGGSGFRSQGGYMLKEGSDVEP